MNRLSHARNFLFAASAFAALGACTTTIQTGGTRVMPGERGALNDPESRFFTEMSEQDEAFRDPARPRDIASAADCPCTDQAPIAATGASDRRAAADSREVQPATTADIQDMSAGEGAGGTIVQDAAVQPERTPARSADSFFEASSSDAGASRPPLPTNGAPTTTFNPVAAGEFNQVGTASWYGRDFDGKPTASGEIFDSRKLTAAHKEIPLGSIVLVRNMENNKEVLVTINDRGPFVAGRVLDVSEYGSELLGFKEQGLTTVGIRVVRVGRGSEQSTGATRQFFSEEGRAAPPVAAGRQTPPAAVPDESSLQQYYAVQVGLFSDLTNARNMERFLQSYNQPVNVLRRGEQYVVKLGQFSSRTQAEALKAQLGTEGYSAFITGPGQ